MQLAGGLLGAVLAYLIARVLAKVTADFSAVIYVSGFASLVTLGWTAWSMISSPYLGEMHAGVKALVAIGAFVVVLAGVLAARQLRTPVPAGFALVLTQFGLVALFGLLLAGLRDRIILSTHDVYGPELHDLYRGLLWGLVVGFLIYDLIPWRPKTWREGVGQP